MKREFIDAQKSFFQRVVQKESQASAHVVLVINSIARSRSHQGSFILELCDGAYSMKCLVTEKSDLHFQCDRYLIEMITSNQIKAGDKFHFQGLYMLNKPVDDTKPIDTQHFYL
jgi:hypothetical protein